MTVSPQETLLMSITVRKQLSVLAWGAALFCSALLLVSATAAAAHKTGHKQQKDQNYQVLVPVSSGSSSLIISSTGTK